MEENPRETPKPINTLCKCEKCQKKVAKFYFKGFNICENCYLKEVGY
jgi:hypothetical protein